MKAPRRKGTAAYQGGSWNPRRESHSAEIGSLWSGVGGASEWAPLQSVVLYQPPLRALVIPDPERAQHLRQLQWPAFRREAAALKKTFLKLGVEVCSLDAGAFPLPPPNLMFARDLFFATPWGAVVARMASRVRAGEEKWAQLALAQTGVPILANVRGRGTFEGADALWISPEQVIVGVGNRTNREGFLQLKKVLSEFGVRCKAVPLPRSVQHLLGLLQIVGPRLAFLRAEITPPEIRKALRRAGYRVVNVSESEEVTALQGMNVVTVGPCRIVMPTRCPALRALFESNGVKVAAELEISQFLNAAGGIACATGILRRQNREGKREK